MKDLKELAFRYNIKCYDGILSYSHRMAQTVNEICVPLEDDKYLYFNEVGNIWIENDNKRHSGEISDRVDVLLEPSFVKRLAMFIKSKKRIENDMKAYFPETR